MKAIVCSRYGSPDVLQVKEVEKPVPKSNEILVKVHASGVTTADSMMRRGTPFYGRLFLGLTKPKNPIPGTGFAGVIEAVGEGVTLFNGGDAVFGETGMGFGANAEYLCLAEDGVVAGMPSNMSYEEAAPICDGPLTSLSFLTDVGHVGAGQNVLINGASGSLGTAAVQIAKYLGAETVGVCSAANVEMVKSLGADIVIDYAKEDFTKAKETYDIIFDTVGKSSFSRCKGAMKRAGAYLSPVLRFPLLLQMMWTAKMGTKRAKFSATGMRPEVELRAHLNKLKSLIEAGTLRTVIDRIYSLDQTPEAHRYVETGHKKGNVVLCLR